MFIKSFIIKTAVAGLLMAALWGCTSSEADNGKYSGTLGTKNREYGLDTVVVDDCKAQADSAINWTTWTCSGGCTDSAAILRVNASLSASCKEAGGRRDTLYLVYIDNGSVEAYFNVDRESYTDTAYYRSSFDQYSRLRVAAIPYHTQATTSVEKYLLGDYFVVKTPSLTSESEITVECNSKADAVPGMRLWWPAVAQPYADLKEIDLTPTGGVCESGDSYRITITNP